ncbi:MULTISPECIES: dTDP-glucose 4,6-dehydratase [Sorangium]|uniref:dTDP-glucose 4,6-dehydratase n=1 Tax=Sorangium atrum TaxID=2995308 RepID=A0ABT5CGW2_9BACT|nr:dTDP-glucose 4,6-dehydratase [Sorangium aterium]MDC0685674.1 dTDP-glucose 4,6-dehydratase [Sorangium aterium]
MKNILVTGGAGFIGSNFIRYVLAERPGVQVVTLDALTYAGRRESLTGLPEQRHAFVHGDIRDRELVERLLSERRIDTIVHFAAESHVDRSIAGPEAFIETNVVGTLRLLEAARTAWLGRGAAEGKRFHHISTDEVFGSLGPTDAAFHEGTPYSPNSPYAASKAASDHLVNAYVHTYGLPATITNCSNNYGPRQFPEKLIPLMILNALTGKPLPVYGDGAQVRDWLYVIDGCEAILRVLERGRAGQSYNIGGGNQPTNLEIVHQICAYLDTRFPESPYRPYSRLLRFVPDRPGHDRRYAVDFRKIERELGWQPRFSLEEGLRETIEWYLANPEWLSAIGRRDDYHGWIERNYTKRGVDQ